MATVTVADYKAWLETVSDKYFIENDDWSDDAFDVDNILEMEDNVILKKDDGLGYLCENDGEGDKDYPAVYGLIVKFKKSLTYTSLVVQVPSEHLESFKAYCDSYKIKVLK